ncbi:hypothetical protein ZIOFF_037482 [Zingiber officinale]|uniref:RRM domain-containing protein n=1 Tax=Zingiber officinale TaxID=94328 RepID=A0A8J5L3G1_ZINOF|nr:hypothetical protein ZIOFF_037482 [Zingiber officinale]
MSKRYSRTIYVGNLPGDIREREVEDLFHKYGPIIDIDLKIPPRPPGYAFIEFEDPRDAEDAIRGRDGYTFDGHKLRVELAHGGRNQSSSLDRHRSYNSGGHRGGVSRRTEYRVMVTGLPSSASWQDLKDHMRRAGDVCFSEVFRNGRGTHGIVDYTNYDDMKYAIKKLDDSEFRNAFSRAYIRVKQYDSERSLSRSRSRSRSYSRSVSPADGRSRSRSRSKSPKAQSSRRSLSGSRSRSASSRSRSRSISRFGLKRESLDWILGSGLDMMEMLATILVFGPHWGQKGMVAITNWITLSGFGFGQVLGTTFATHSSSSAISGPQDSGCNLHPVMANLQVKALASKLLAAAEAYLQLLLEPHNDKLANKSPTKHSPNSTRSLSPVTSPRDVKPASKNTVRSQNASPSSSPEARSD